MPNKTAMKKLFVLAVAAFFAVGVASAQHHHGNCGQCPNHAKHQAAAQAKPQVNADGIDMAIVRAFPTVKSVKKADKWTEVYDVDSKLLGYAVYSKPASDGIKGYNGETPLLIALSPKWIILGVWLLPNQETPKFAQQVEAAGFYKNWNGLTVKKALKKEVDAVSGATFTSTAVMKSFRAALEKL